MVNKVKMIKPYISLINDEE